MHKPSLLITRPKETAGKFLAGLNSSVLQERKIIISPLLQITPTAGRPDFGKYPGVIFTSANAVKFAPAAGGRFAYCVGESTARQAETAGWKINVIAENAKSLIEHLTHTEPQGPLIHLVGRHQRGDIAETLTGLGIHVDVHILYEQELLSLSEEAQLLLDAEQDVVVPLFSPRTAAQFFDQATKSGKVIVIAISDAVANVCKGYPVKDVIIAEAPTGQEMMRSVEKALCDTSFA